MSGGRERPGAVRDGRARAARLDAILVVVLVVGAVLVCSPAVAGPDAPACASEDLAEVRSLHGLPDDIVEQLHHQHNGDAIADVGKDFQEFDSGYVGALPFRRFAAAGLGPTCAVVAIEHGGRGDSVELYRFVASGSRWRVDRRTFTVRKPRSLNDLIADPGIPIPRAPVIPGAGVSDE